MFCDYLNKLCEGSRDQERKKKVLSQPLGVFDVLATNQIWPELQLWGYGTCEKKCGHDAIVEFTVRLQRSQGHNEIVITY